MGSPFRLAAVLIPGILLVAGHFVGRALPRRDRPPEVPTAAPDKPRPELPADLRPGDRTAVELLERSEAAATPEFPALLQRAFVLDDNDEGSLRTFVIRQLVARWAKLDAPGALTWLAANAPEGNWMKDGALRTLFEIWGADDPFAAIEVGQASGFDGALDAVLRANAKRNPELFLDLVARLGPRWNQNTSTSMSLHQTAFEELGRRDPEALGKWLNGDEPEPVASAAARALATVLVENRGGDAYAALAALAALASPDLREAAMERATELLLKTNLPGANEFLERTLADGQDAAPILNGLLRAKSLEDPFGAARWFSDFIKNHPGPATEGDRLRQAMSGFYQTIPADAALLHRFASEIGAALPEFSINNLLASAGSLTRPEPRHRADLARDLLALPLDTLRNEMLTTLIGHWAGEDGGAARSFAEALPVEALRHAARTQILENGNATPEDILAIVTDPDWNGPVPERALKTFADSAPETALAYFATLDAETAREAAPVIAHSLASRDPAAGRAWIEGITDEDTQVLAARRFAQTASYDTFALSEWATSLPAGPLLDAVAVPLVSHIAASDPASAFNWSHVIVDAQIRATSLKLSISNWAAWDRAGAENAVREDTRLSDAERIALLRRLAETTGK